MKKKTIQLFLQCSRKEKRFEWGFPFSLRTVSIFLLYIYKYFERFFDIARWEFFISEQSTILTIFGKIRYIPRTRDCGKKKRILLTNEFLRRWKMAMSNERDLVLVDISKRRRVGIY